MIEFIISLAGVRVAVSALHEQTREFCRDYLDEGPGELSVTVTQSDIDFERDKSAREDALEGIPLRQFSDEYLETLAVYRKIADAMLSCDTLLFHGSAIAVDGDAYLFTAKSGTGKSTHTRLWRRAFGERAVMVNDDKPLLRVEKGSVRVCGTPWDGKHRLSTNTTVPLKGICILERGEENRIDRISSAEALPMILQQTHRPADPGKLFYLLGLVERMMEAVPIYRLKCNMDPDAARVAFDGMQRKEE